MDRAGLGAEAELWCGVAVAGCGMLCYELGAGIGLCGLQARDLANGAVRNLVGRAVVR